MIAAGLRALILLAGLAGGELPQRPSFGLAGLAPDIEADGATTWLCRFSGSARPDYALSASAVRGDAEILPEGALRLTKRTQLEIAVDERTLNAAEGTVECRLRFDDPGVSPLWWFASILDLDSHSRPATEWAPGEWHHVAVSWRAGQWHLFLDGSEVDQGPWSRGSETGSGRLWFSGAEASIDDLRISDVARYPAPERPVAGAPRPTGSTAVPAEGWAPVNLPPPPGEAPLVLRPLSLGWHPHWIAPAPEDDADLYLTPGETGVFSLQVFAREPLRGISISADLPEVEVEVRGLTTGGALPRLHPFDLPAGGSRMVILSIRLPDTIEPARFLRGRVRATAGDRQAESPLSVGIVALNLPPTTDYPLIGAYDIRYRLVEPDRVVAELRALQHAGFAGVHLDVGVKFAERALRLVKEAGFTGEVGLRHELENALEAIPIQRQRRLAELGRSLREILESHPGVRLVLVPKSFAAKEEAESCARLARSVDLPVELLSLPHEWLHDGLGFLHARLFGGAVRLAQAKGRLVALVPPAVPLEGPWYDRGDLLPPDPEMSGGVLPSLGLLGLRQGIEDLRAFTLLLTLADAAAGRWPEAAAEARQSVGSLTRRLPAGRTTGDAAMDLELILEDSEIDRIRLGALLRATAFLNPGALRVRARGPDGAPLPYVLLTVMGPGGTPVAGLYDHRLDLDAEGRGLVTGLLAGDYSVRLHTVREFRSEEGTDHVAVSSVSVPLSGLGEVDGTLAPGGRIRVSLTHADGRGAPARLALRTPEGVPVSATFWRGEAGGWVTDAFPLSPPFSSCVLPPGRYRVEARRLDRVVAAADVEVTAGGVAEVTLREE